MTHDFDVTCHACGARLKLDDHRRMDARRRSAMFRAWVRTHAACVKSLVRPAEQQQAA